MTVDTTDAGNTASTSDNLPAVPEGASLAEIKANLPEISPEFAEQYPVFDPDVDLDALMTETLGEGKTLRVADLTTIKVPSADAGKKFSIPDENGDLMPAKDGLKGIPAAWKMRRSYWESKDVTGARPDCSSNDMITGRGMFGPGSPENRSGKCETCPMSQRGSADSGTAASACKEQRLLFLLTGDEVFPYLVIFPPASLTEFNAFGAFLAKRGRRGPERPEMGIDPRTNRTWRASAWLTAEVKLDMAQDKNAAGVAFNYITVKQARQLQPNEVAWVNAVGRTIDRMIVEQEEALDSLLAGEGVVTEDGAPRTGGATEDHGGTDPDDDLGGFEDEAELGNTSAGR